MTEFKIHPIPRVHSPKHPKWWHVWAFAHTNTLYHEKGVTYLPNFSDRGENWLESYKYRLETSDNQNGAFKWVIQHLIHENLHEILYFEELGSKTVLFDNIDKTSDDYYIITAIQGAFAEKGVK